MRFLQSSWCPVCLGIIATALILYSLLDNGPKRTIIQSLHESYKENEEWIPPRDDEIPPGPEGDQILYGKELIANTAEYLGPKGIISRLSNGMNCQNCHIDAGRQNFANPFSGAANSYPKYRDRSGRVESIEFRVNECMQRSMNGSVLDSLSPEMRAIVAYVKWVGRNVPPDTRPKGIGTEKLPFLERAADPQKGKTIYTVSCLRCHGENGEGLMMADSAGYTYPPLWGPHSYNVSAGMHRLSMLAGFIKNNMPQGATWKDPVLTNEEAWDLAAYIASQQRTLKFFSYDWRDISKKPVDYPFGPYPDSLSEDQHKYGPFGRIKK
jgi:thiosulfate dehydrogenase